MISQWGLILALLCSVSLSKRYSVYRITPQSNDSLQFLEGLTKDMGIDFWKEPRAVGQEVHIMIPDPKSVALLNDLRSRNISFSLMIDDVEKVIKNQKLARLKLKSERRQKDFRDGKVDFNLAEYHSFADVINYFNALAITYPHLVSVHPIGLTHEGRQIPLIKITNKRMGGRKRSMWIDGGIHAREWISPSTVLYFIHQLINGYDQDPIIRRYVDNIEWHLVPLLNPDGYEYSRSSTDPEIRLWRKNKSPSKCTTTAQGGLAGLFSPPQTTCCQGVDLNRNFDWFFGQVGSSTDPCSEIYNGAFAFSEPETRAVRDFISQHPITSFVTLHSYSQILMYPFGHQVRTYSNDLDDLRNTALSAANALQRLYGTTYKVGTGADTLYPASGGSEDWAKGKGGVKYSYLFELRPEEQVWDGFLLPENQIMPTARETWEAIKVIATHTLSVPFGASASSGGFHHSRAQAASPSLHSPPPSPSPPLPCRDHDELCAAWAAGGACETWPEMRQRCPLTCRLCRPTDL